MFTSTVVNAEEVVSQSVRDVCTRQTSPFIHAKANLDPMHGGTSKVDSGVFRVIVVCGWGVDSVETTAVIGGVYSLYCLGLPHRRLFNMPMPRGLGALQVCLLTQQ